MLPTLATPLALSKATPPRVSRRRHARLVLCPRCNQWRTRAQLPLDAPYCGGCASSIQYRAERAAAARKAARRRAAARARTRGQRYDPRGDVERAMQLRGADLIEDVAWLIDCGEPADVIAHRVRRASVDALARTLQRLEHHELRARLLERRGALL